jgi:hypothetical protein
VPIQVRKGGKNLWSNHPEVDLAAMFVSLPRGVIATVLPSSFILADEKIKEYELGPGTELLCLGYPLGVESNDFGFAILRSGKIASYPLLPQRRHEVFGSILQSFQEIAAALFTCLKKVPSTGEVCTSE